MQAKYVWGIVTIILLYYSSIFFKGFANSYLDESNCYFFLLSLYACVVGYLVVLFFKPLNKIFITKIDIFLVGVWGIFECSVAVYHELHLTDDGIILINSLFVLYFFLRAVTGSTWQINALCAILFSGFLFELTMGIYDLVSVDFSQINNLTAKGNFDNSGIYMAYVVGLSPFSFYVLNNLRYNWLRWSLLLLCGVMLSILIFVTASRASAIGLIIISLVFYLYNKKGYKYWMTRGIPIAVFLILLSAAMTIKQGSNAGRWLIWKITFHNILKHPLIGYGPTTFSKNYPYWQATYFSHTEKYNVKYQIFADVSHVTFNEYLQVFSETGIVGLILFGLLIFLLFRVKATPGKEEYMRLFKASILFYLIFALFSYPFHLAPILVVFIISISAISSLSSESRMQFSFPGIAGFSLRLIATVIFVLFLGWLSGHLMAVTTWRSVDQVAVNDEQEAMKNYQELYKTLNSCSPFLLRYGENLLVNRHPRTAICVLERANTIYPSEKGYILLGSAMELNENLEGAGNCYKMLMNMVPGHFEPKYLLVKVYLQQHDSINAKYLAKNILTMPVKIPSDQVSEIKAEMKMLTNNK